MPRHQPVLRHSSRRYSSHQPSPVQSSSASDDETTADAFPLFQDGRRFTHPPTRREHIDSRCGSIPYLVLTDTGLYREDDGGQPVLVSPDEYEGYKHHFYLSNCKVETLDDGDDEHMPRFLGDDEHQPRFRVYCADGSHNDPFHESPFVEDQRTASSSLITLGPDGAVYDHEPDAYANGQNHFDDAFAHRGRDDGVPEMDYREMDDPLGLRAAEAEMEAQLYP